MCHLTENAFQSCETSLLDPALGLARQDLWGLGAESYAQSFYENIVYILITLLQNFLVNFLVIFIGIHLKSNL